MQPPVPRRSIPRSAYMNPAAAMEAAAAHAAAAQAAQQAAASMQMQMHMHAHAHAQAQSQWMSPRRFTGMDMAASGLATLSTTAQQMGKSSTAAEGGTLFQGGEALGSALMLIFFAVIGVSSNLVGALSLGLNVVPFLLIQLTVHIVVLVTLGRASGLSTQSMLIASNANIGGPATAAAMAATRGWGGMVQPALLTGSLGYAIGTSVGLATARILTNT